MYLGLFDYTKQKSNQDIRQSKCFVKIENKKSKIISKLFVCKKNQKTRKIKNYPNLQDN